MALKKAKLNGQDERKKGRKKGRRKHVSKATPWEANKLMKHNLISRAPLSKKIYGDISLKPEGGGNYLQQYSVNE